MTKIVASAPNKIQLAGEHSVVYGGKTLIAPMEVNGKRNVIKLTAKPSPAKIEFIGKGVGETGKAVLHRDGSKSGDDVWQPMLDLAQYVLNDCGKNLNQLNESIVAERFFSGAPKGTGNSASISAAFALALYTLFEKQPSKKDLFQAAFVADNSWHGGKSSGADLHAVISDCPQKFWREFKKTGIEPRYEDFRCAMPKNTVLVLIDSHKGSDEKATTAEQIEKFVKAHGVMKNLTRLTEQERKKIYLPFDEIVERIEREMRLDGNPEKLGKYFNENHALLRNSNVSSPEIEEIISASRENGALGAKLVGAGGAGGAVIALCREEKAHSIMNALKEKGFNSWTVKFAEKGACVDSVQK